VFTGNFILSRSDKWTLYIVTNLNIGCEYHRSPSKFVRIKSYRKPPYGEHIAWMRRETRNAYKISAMKPTG
jgi:hypothetical protein